MLMTTLSSNVMNLPMPLDEDVKDGIGIVRNYESDLYATHVISFLNAMNLRDLQIHKLNSDGLVEVKIRFKEESDDVQIH